MLARSALLPVLALCCGAAAALGPYTLHVPTGSPQPVASALLGYSVAASRRAGSAYAVAGALVARHVVLFALRDGPPALQAIQQLASPSTSDDFGAAVALDHGFEQTLIVAVGANTDDGAAFNAGRVHLYSGAGSPLALALQQQLVSPNPVVSGNFGTSLALSGEVLIVGEPKAMRAGQSVELGAAHVYRRSGGSWSLSTSLYGTDPGGRFGQSVALHDATLLVGAALEDDVSGQLVDTGAGYVYRLIGEDWVLEQRLLAADRQTGDRLGISAAIDGDTAVFGAANDDKLAGTDAGSAYVFERAQSSWLEQAKLRSTQPQVQERFGQSVAVDGDDVVVGAYCLFVSGCSGAGAAYVYRRSDGDWQPVQRLAPNTDDGENFAHALAFAGRDRLVIGAFNADLGGPVDRGAVYLLTGADALFYSGME